MEKKDERYLNITLNNSDSDKDEVVLSFSGLFAKFKKYFLIWLVTAVVAGVLVLASSFVFAPDELKTLTALVSFTYDGIEEGLDPDGRVFDVNSLKNPSVIEDSLTKLGLPLSELENVRQGIYIKGVLPSDAIDRITAYKSVYENASSGNLSAAQAMLDVSYYPTQYKITFNYAQTGFDADTAVQVFNTVLECYRDYFFETYGYNEALGSAVTALKYTDYDYAEAVDVFDTTLKTLKSYVNNLSSEDTTRFRSAETGYTFADLATAISTVQSMDLDILSSYITVNNVTKDKDTLIFYYQYRIDNLSREKIVAEENLASITESLNNYEKDTVMIFGNGTEGTDTVSNVASDKYDSLIQQKINAQDTLSTVTQQINFYNQRMTALKSNPAGSQSKMEKVEADLAALDAKVASLIDSVNKTADEYYNTVSFANAYNILVPASSSTGGTIKSIIKNGMMPGIIAEALIFVAYVAVAFVTAVISENKKRKAAAEAHEDNDTADGGDDKTEEKTDSRKNSNK